ncbi:carbohydrate ABC transporter permease [Paenibacillus alkaliterrae]|uniref:carbohydrate ABC transporter permease n=1 Tax=Paenibacillus alkaliterrae TaxID=320909 RepID=UPI001F3F34A3|nr:carbohydrate ABC transporter permease [Paenibacillus alkaliterrae]MCF2938550.1 carbohydrate ABC transporter permease [Paenibacillus alkaliterrae]
MRASYVKNSTSGRIFDVFNVLFMVILAFVMVYPFWNQLIVSFNDGVDTARGGLYFWPREFTLDNYHYMFEKSNLAKGALISILRVVVGTVTTLFFSGLLAYVTTVKWFSGRRFTRFLFLITLYFSGGLVPTYLLINKLNLMDTFTVYWLPSLFSAYYMLLISSYMYNLPDALAESARIDGCNELMIYMKIIAPLCIPVFAAVAVFSAVSHWNSWFDVILYNSSGKWDTLQVYLRKILLDVEQVGKLADEQKQMAEMRKLTPQSIRAATTMIVTLPIMLSYPFFQRYFMSGITIGAVKE